MFAVSRKPISNTGKFVIKNDFRDTKTRIEESAPKIPQEGPKFENVASSKNFPPAAEKPEAKPVPLQKEEAKEVKKVKIRLSIIKDVPYAQKSTMANPAESNAEKRLLKKTKEMKIKHKRIHREGNFNCGRWQPEEHERFIEAIMKYGNEWKSVQRHVGTRSSTQARSHAQKFFVKIKKTNLLDLNMDLSKNSIKTLHEIANTMNAEEYFNAIKTLNCVAFERKNNPKRKNKRDDSFNDSSDFFSEAPNVLNLNEDIFSLTTNDNTLFNCNKLSDSAASALNSNPLTKKESMAHNSNLINNTLNNFNNNLNSFINNNSSNLGPILFNNNPGNYQVKIITNEKSDNPKKGKKEKGQSVNTIIINNNINNYNYNVNINNFNEKEHCLNKKRSRMNSYEGLINLFPELGKEYNNNYSCHFKTSFDDNEYVDNFNCTFKNVKNDFGDEKDLDLLLLSQSDELPNYNHGNLMNNFMTSEFIFDELMMDLQSDKKAKNSAKYDDSDEIKIEPLFFI